MTTASTLIAQAAVRYKDPSNAVISAGQWLQYLNQCYSDVNEASPLWPWLESAEETVTVLAGQRSGALPANVFQVNWAYDTTDDYRLVDQQGRGDQWHQDHLRSETGQPVTYRLRANVLELFPAPLVNTTVVCECVEYPADLGTVTTTVYGIAGAAAGDHTVTGIAVGDQLISVVAVNDTTHASTDVTSEYTVTVTNTINNSGGTSSVGSHLVVTAQRPSTTGSPVYPSIYHSDLLDGMLALAYLDEGNDKMYGLLWPKFEASITQMRADMLLYRSETNPPIRDTFWS